LVALQAENSELWAKTNAQAETARAADESRTNETSRLKTELDQAYSDKAELNNRLIDAQAGAESAAQHVATLTAQVALYFGSSCP
jgi:chromosome segregation ATPase